MDACFFLDEFLSVLCCVDKSLLLKPVPVLVSVRGSGFVTCFFGVVYGVAMVSSVSDDGVFDCCLGTNTHIECQRPKTCKGNLDHVIQYYASGVWSQVIITSLDGQTAMRLQLIGCALFKSLCLNFTGGRIWSGEDKSKPRRFGG